MVKMALLLRMKGQNLVRTAEVMTRAPRKMSARGTSRWRRCTSYSFLSAASKPRTCFARFFVLPFCCRVCGFAASPLKPRPVTPASLS